MLVEWRASDLLSLRVWEASLWAAPEVLAEMDGLRYPLVFSLTTNKEGYMRQHVLAFGAAALDASAGNVQLVAVSEQAFSKSGGNNFQIPKPLKIFAGYVGGVGLLRGRVNTGSLRSRGFPQIYPLNLTVLPPTPPKVMDIRYGPLQLVKEEDLRVDVTNGGAQDTAALLWVTPDDVEQNINSRDLRILRFTATVTAVALAWSTPATIVFEDLIEGGVYDIYGMGIQSATGVAARLIIQGDFYRPGCLAQTLATAYVDDMFMGGTGKWASFNTYSPPQIESFDSAAGASSIVGWLLCSKSLQTTNTDNR